MSKTKILFFFPFGQRTGSEMSLYNLICHAELPDVAMAVTSKTDGELLRALPARISNFPQKIEAGNNRLIKATKRLLRRPRQAQNRKQILLSIHEQYQPDIWYINTIVQPEILRLARAHNIPCIVHAHELEQMLVQLTERDTLDLIEYPKLIIACSKAVAEVFRVLGRKTALEVQYEAICFDKIKQLKPEKSKSLRRNLGIGDDTFVWAMSGVIDANKNPAAFIDAAQQIAKLHANVHFIWLGKIVSGYGLYASERARYLNVSDKITWVGELTDSYYEYLNMADGFVLTSTRDSFPLVMIEAAALGKPIVSFNSGGVREFVQPGMGTVIDSWNVSDLAAAMIEVMQGRISFEPQKAKERAARFDVTAKVQHWQEILHRHLPPRTVAGRENFELSLCRSQTEY